MELDNSFYALVGMIIFIGILVYMKVPKAITGALDSKIEKIQTELDEAKRLREEAQALLAEYERKRKAAQSEADDIITAAKEDAKRMSAEAQIALEELIIRRTKSVEEKIAQAEAHAVGEVRARSADVAIEAAQKLLEKQMLKKGDDYINQSIKEVGAKLN